MENRASPVRSKRMAVEGAGNISRTCLSEWRLFWEIVACGSSDGGSPGPRWDWGPPITQGGSAGLVTGA